MNAPQASADDVAAKIGGSTAPLQPSRIDGGRGSDAESRGAPSADAAKSRAIEALASHLPAESAGERAQEIPVDLAPSSQMRVARIPGSAEVAQHGCIHVRFTHDLASSMFALAVASLFSSAAEEMVIEDANGRLRDDLDIHELRQRLEAGLVASLRFKVRLLDVVANLTLTLGRGSSPASATVTAPVALGANPSGTLWLQADLAHHGPLPVLALPAVEGAFTQDALHALIAVTARAGSFAGAHLVIGDAAESSLTWWPANPSTGARPFVGSNNDTIWALGSQPAAAVEPVAWCLASSLSEEPTSLSAEWWTHFDTLTRTPGSLVALEHHLRAAVPSAPPWRLIEPAHAPSGAFMVPAEDGVVVSLLPMADEVLVAVDPQQSSVVVATSVLHALAHLALGHVRPGDRWGHWDTVKTVTEDAPHRMWDQDAKTYVARWLTRPPNRQVESLDQCTPTEKAQLGLWRMIGERLGESRRLHPAAERYQRAAYQRQAAQRLVSMLEEFGGAMLCDGVGLGKTYVATTLMVHYANIWRDQWAATPERLVEDPFRITVLAPHSVVSTWRREAIPGLAASGVPLATIRVISHTRLSRMSRASELLAPERRGLSDVEHLLLSDLVLVDEAHNFRSLAARRTKVLRDLLRLQPRRESRRRVALLTATPVNNSLDDLRQEVSLLFSRPLLLSDAKTDDGYRRQAFKEIQDRCSKARATKARGDVAALVIHGQADARFADSIEFRDDLDFGPNVQRIGDYLKEQDKRLKEVQDRIRTAAQAQKPQQAHAPVRIAEELLDRIVVQRSRALCKDIERQQSSTVEILFRTDAGVPEKLRYSDEYDGIEDVLKRFLPLFDAGAEKKTRLAAERPLSLKVYMWYDVREGLKSPDETSSVIGLQRVLVLKRLESSPISFLITLLRLTVLHAHRMHQLGDLCLTSSDTRRYKLLQSEIAALLNEHDDSALAKIRSLAAGDPALDSRAGFLKCLSVAHAADRPAADTDDPPPQLSLFEDGAGASPTRDELDRLWPLREAILDDFKTLLAVTPELADIVFGKFDRSQWPRRFIAGGEKIDWPTSAEWGLRLVTDAKLRQLVARLVLARRAHQKTVVFSQFSDTIAYIQSVLRACKSFGRSEWQLVLRGLGVPNLTNKNLTELLAVTETITGDTEDRDDVVNAFAPFYRIGPTRPAPTDALDGALKLLDDAWEASWTAAIVKPIDVLLSTDVLAEGVNLQDAALLINFDVHWNPVRMIQRAGRIDRRLNPRIEHAREFPDLEALAARLKQPKPVYYWHDRRDEPPVTVNMILPDELEAELLLRERIATKTLAIDFTLGLEQGTGAEADWMAEYKYQGITSLNSFQKDRAIEQIAGHRERLSRALSVRGVRPEWAENLNGWFRCKTATSSSPLVGRALLGRRGGELERFSRYLEPAVKDGVPFWFWAEKQPGESMFDGWLVLDGRPENFPPHPRRDIPFDENSSTPVRASHLLGAAEYLAGDPDLEVLPAKEIGRPLMQGASAFAAPKLGTEEDRRQIALRDFYILQLPTFDPVLSLASAARLPTIPPTSGREGTRNEPSHAE